MFDGSLDGVTAYNATIRIANDTTFDTDGGDTWVRPDGLHTTTGATRSSWTKRGESLNLTVNAVADVLHTLHNEAHHERRATSIVMGQITAADAIIALHMAVCGGYDDAADMSEGRVMAPDALTIPHAATGGVEVD